MTTNISFDIEALVSYNLHKNTFLNVTTSKFESRPTNRLKY